MELADLTPASIKSNARLRANLENTRSCLEKYGILVIYDAFETASLDGLLTAAATHLNRVEEAISKGACLEFPDKFMYLHRSLACNVTSLDPATARFEDNNFPQTTLLSTIMTSYFREVLIDTLGFSIGWALARARVVIPHRDGTNGHLELHMEKTAVRFPGVHNIWIPLTPEGVVTNESAPGIQLYIGKLDFFSLAASEQVTHELKSLNSISLFENPQSIDGFFYRPRLKTGDLIIFNGSIPHGSYFPPCANFPRVSCDVRVFPWIDTNFLPDEAVAMGQRHGRLI